MNKYLTKSAPWTLYNRDPNNPEIVKIIGTTLSTVWTIIMMLTPIMPETTNRILSYIAHQSKGNELVMTVKKGFSPFFQPLSLKIKDL